MTLAEKIAALRSEHRLSQGDLAERLDVSRQSVSKWETGQAVPELDKIIRLADLFGVSVDELVRGGDASPAAEPEASPAGEAQASPEPKIVYVERQGLRGAQIFGALLLALGLICALWSFFISYSVGAMLASLAAMMGLPFLLCKKHPFLIAGWVLIALSLLFLNPYTSVSAWGLVGGFRRLAYCLSYHGGYSEGMGAAVGILRGTLVLFLAARTLQLRQRRKAKTG